MWRCCTNSKGLRVERASPWVNGSTFCKHVHCELALYVGLRQLLLRLLLLLVLL